MVYIDPKYSEKIKNMHEALKDPTFYFDGEYIFHPSEYPNREGTVGYALVSRPESNDFGDAPTAVYYVYYREAPGKLYIGWDDPPFGDIVYTTGTFYPFQKPLF